MNSHTRGPWLIDTADRDICVQLPNGEFLEIASVGCMDHNGVKYWFGPESWANACLLRSAPDLLEALEHAERTIHKLQAEQTTTIRISKYLEEARAKASAAIAKAKGEPA